MSTKPQEPDPHVVRGPGPTWFRRVLTCAAALYIAAVVARNAGCSTPDSVLPKPALYLTQIACLFPHASVYSIDYRVSGYSCHEGRYRELDYRTYFPIHPDDKENRFQRVGHFYRSHPVVMKALDEYLVERHNQRVATGGGAGDGIDGPIGSILVQSLRIPFPEPGTRIERYEAKPLSEIPRDWRKAWYATPSQLRSARCEAAP